MLFFFILYRKEGYGGEDEGGRVSVVKRGTLDTQIILKLYGGYTTNPIITQ